MLYDFLIANKDLLVERCHQSDANRTSQGVARADSAHGIAVFLGQLIKTLQTEVAFDDAKSRDISGTADGGPGTSEIGVTAAIHGNEMLQQGVLVDQVVHDYGDICQAITTLAGEQSAPITINEFRTLNRCLDNAIAAAVTEHQYQFGQEIQQRTVAELNEQLGMLAHEMRNQLNTVNLTLAALKSGHVGFEGATGVALNRALVSLRSLIDRSLADVRVTGGIPPRTQEVWLTEFISEISSSASLEATARNCQLTVPAVDASLAVNADRDMLFSAVGNLLTNAFKFTKSGTAVSLRAYASSDRILIEVADHCGGLPPGGAENLFKPFYQEGEDRSGMGLGLAICRRGVEANGGILNGRDIPGHGCVFTIDLPRYVVS